MRQIIKFCGITAEQVAALDKVLASPAVQTSVRYNQQISTGYVSEGFVSFARRLRVEAGDGESGYVYELALESALTLYLYGHSREGCSQQVVVRCPRRVLLAIFEAVGEMPDNDQPETMDAEGWATERAIQKHLEYKGNRR